MTVLLGALFALLIGPIWTSADYPLTLTLDATADAAAATVASSVTIRVDRLMEENRRKRVTDALTYSGYGHFLNALRAIPVIGAIELGSRSVDIRYAHEQQEEAAGGRRLLLVADRPLFFLSGDPAKTRAGFELTIVELRFDARGEVSGTIMGAARVKPSPDGVVAGDFADAPVRLRSRAARP
jgi:hypothetical protein